MRNMSELSELYQEVILDHSKAPHNFRALMGAGRKAEGYNPLCGDQITIYLKLSGDTIRDISFEGKGCAISKASASIMTDAVKNKSRREVQGLYDQFHQLVTGPPGQTVDEATLGKLAAFSGVCEFPTRVKCAILAWHTLRSALDAVPGVVTTEDGR